MHLKTEEPWRVLFRYAGKQHTFWIGEVSEEAAAVDKVDYWLMRLKQELVKLPAGCDVVTSVQNDGRPPEHSVEVRDLALVERPAEYGAFRRDGVERRLVEAELPPRFAGGLAPGMPRAYRPRTVRLYFRQSGVAPASGRRLRGGSRGRG